MLVDTFYCSFAKKLREGVLFSLFPSILCMYTYALSFYYFVSQQVLKILVFG